MTLSVVSVRRGFTTIELMVVLMIAAVIVTATIPAILPTLRKNAVNRAAASILAVAEQARRLARSSMDSTRLYGVTVDGSGSGAAYATIWYNGAELVDPVSNAPVMRRSLGGNAAPYTSWTQGSKTPFTPSASMTTWLYQSQTGVVVKDVSGAPSEIGSGTGNTDPYVGALNLVSTKPSLTVAGAPENVTAPTAMPPYFGVCSLDGEYGVGIVIFHIGLGYSRELAKAD
jgi:prepilin-type N-terminal cleavage/methylation domain-containing protein